MYIYFIQSGKKGPIKIGKAKNIERRMENLQTGCAYKLNLLAVIKCDNHLEASQLEKKIHHLFKRQRLQGEWFQPNINFKKAMKFKYTPNFTTVPRFKKLTKEVPDECRQHMDSIMNESGG